MARSQNTAERLRIVAAITVLLVLAFASGCAHRGPRTMVNDRFDYHMAIGESWKTQTLLNIVKLRYLDSPVFLEVNQLVTSYNWEHTGNLQFTVRSLFGSELGDQSALGYTGKYVERPTISYSLIRGEKFVNTLLTPVPPSLVFILLDTGWPVDFIFKMLVHSVNGTKNLHVIHGSGAPADPLFTAFVDLLHRFQRHNALSVTVKRHGEEDISTALNMHPDRVSAADRQELDELKGLLGLSRELNTYQVTWGSLPPNPDTLMVQTRSIHRLMSTLGWYIDIPPEDIEGGIVAPFVSRPEDDAAEQAPLMRIHCGASLPDAPYAAVRYNKRWYWIDRADVASKRLFAFLSMLLNLTEAGEGGEIQLVLPGRLRKHLPVHKRRDA